MVASKLLAIVPFIVAASASDYAPGKRGLATNDVGVDLYGFRTTFFEQSKVRWQYNWDSDCSNRVDFTEFVPMLWSDAYDHTRQWDEHVRKWLGQGTQHLLAFNEPDGVPNQSNMTVNQAVNAYRQYMHPYGGSARLGAPAVSNGGWNWISQFMNQCSGCQIDFIPVHWYNQWWQEDDFERWVNQICSLGRPVWITEFKGLGSQDQQKDFLAKAMDFLERTSCVERYSYFGSAQYDQDFIDSSTITHLTELGIQYSLA